MPRYLRGRRNRVDGAAPMTLRQDGVLVGGSENAKSSHTWAHETRRSARRFRHLACGSKTKVSDEDVDVSALRRYEDVLRLKVPVINATCMTVLERVDDLNEDALNEFILTEEHDLLYDRVKVAGAEVVYVEDVETLLELTVEGEYVGVRRDTSMELFLASVINSSALLLDALDGVVHVGVDVDGAVDNAKCPSTQDGLDPEGTLIDCLSHRLGCGDGIRGHGCRGGC